MTLELSFICLVYIGSPVFEIHHFVLALAYSEHIIILG